MRMKFTTVCLALLTVLAMAVGAIAATPSGEFTVSKITAEKQVLQADAVKTEIYTKPAAEPVYFGEKQGGEDIANAVVIPDLGQDATAQMLGTTAGYVDDYDEACPDAANSPDVVYSYTPVLEQNVDLLLCFSSYKTKLYIYEGSYTPGDPFACNQYGDPYCEPMGDFPRSALVNLYFAAGVTYYIVIDGWQGESGEYQLDIETRTPVTLMAGHPAIAYSPTSDYLILGYDYVGPDDTTVWWFGSTDGGVTGMDEGQGWTNNNGFPHVDLHSGDSLFVGGSTNLSALGSWCISVMSHPVLNDGTHAWTGYSMDFSGHGWNGMHVHDIACSDEMADQLDGDGLPWAYGLICMTSNSSYGDGYTDEPFIGYATSETGGTISWYGFTEDGYHSSYSTCDIDKEDSLMTIVVSDMWHDDSLAWGLFFRQDRFINFASGEYDSAYEYGSLAFLRDEAPTAYQSVRHPSVQRHASKIVVVAEYYTDLDTDVQLVCLNAIMGAIWVDNVATDSGLVVEVVGMVSEGVGDEKFPDLMHISGDEYVCSFIRNDSLFKATTTDAGANWTVCPTVDFGDVGINHDVQYVLLEETAGDPPAPNWPRDAQVFDISEGGAFQAWQYRTVNDVDSSTHPMYGNMDCLSSGGCCVGIRGNVDNDPLDEFNIADLVYLVNYMFREGSPEPECWEEADVDAPNPSGTSTGDDINVADLVYMANYMFKEGPIFPDCP